MTGELDRERRRLITNALVFVGALALVVATTYAVHYDASMGLPDGTAGTLLAALEVVFIAGIIPLVITATYCGIAVGGLMLTQRRRRRAVPPARARR